MRKAVGRSKTFVDVFLGTLASSDWVRKKGQSQQTTLITLTSKKPVAEVGKTFGPSRHRQVNWDDRFWQEDRGRKMTGKDIFLPLFSCPKQATFV